MVESLADDRANEARGDAATTNLVLLLAASVHRAVTAAQPGFRADGRQAQVSSSCVPALPFCAAKQLDQRWVWLPCRRLSGPGWHIFCFFGRHRGEVREWWPRLCRCHIPCCLMGSSVCALLTGSIAHCRKVMGKAKAATAAASARQEVTLVLSQPLPALLRKFQTEPTKARAPCRPPRHTGLTGRGTKRRCGSALMPSSMPSLSFVKADA